jgi:hypothetical protein
LGYCRAAGLAGASATPVPPRLHLKLGIALQAQGRLEEAISNFTAATAGSYGLVADGDDEGGVASEAHHHAGLSLKRLGRLAEAVSCCLLACNGSPCLRHCGHGASIGEQFLAVSGAGAAACRGWPPAACGAGGCGPCSRSHRWRRSCQHGRCGGRGRGGRRGGGGEGIRRVGF